ncbi:MAG: MerR family transcriptional regulator/heat shock protein HspR [Nitriliruptoraceae bacterium]|jgi:MerR family transcriptional regulator/heat shock protein HspR
MSEQRFLAPEDTVVVDDEVVVELPLKDDDSDTSPEPKQRRAQPRGAFGQRGPGYDEAVYVISVAADLADLHPQTLRAYEREGLVEPARTGGNTRRYSQSDIDRLRFIRHLTTEEGLNLAGVRVVLDLGEKLEDARTRVHELEDMVRTLGSRLQTDVADAHRSHRFEVVPAGRREMEPHPTMRRRPPKAAAKR